MSFLGNLGAILRGKRRKRLPPIDWRLSAREQKAELIPLRHRRKHTRLMCGCTSTKIGKRNAVRCPIPGKRQIGRKGYLYKFLKPHVKAPKCTQMPVLSRGKKFSFRTRAGKLMEFGRGKPKMATVKKHTAFYFNQLRRKLLKSGRKPKFMPSFADIHGGGW